MSEPTRRVVFDCNVFLQALGNPNGPAGRCVQEALARRVTLFVDEALLEELQDVVSRPEVTRKLRILATRVDALVDDLKSVAVFIKDVPVRFTCPRDPDDAHYVNLAVAATASLIVSRDKDLLDLMDDRTEDGRTFRAHFRSLRILPGAVSRGDFGGAVSAAVASSGPAVGGS